MASSLAMRADCSSSSSGDSMRCLAEGEEIELYRTRGARVYLVDAEASVLMHKGDFVFSLATHARAPLAALVAMVGDLQWPVGKDSPAMRVGDKCFTCALHGLIYGLVLGEFTTAAEIKKVEDILQKYATFKVLSEIVTDAKQGKEKLATADAQADYWTRMAVSLETTSAESAKQSDSWGSSRQVASGALSGLERGEGGVLSLRLARRMQQMRRVSAVAKLLTKALVKGMIKPYSHVQVRGGEKGGEKGGEGPAGMPLASVDAVTMVVEAVETGGTAILEWVRRGCADQPADTGSDDGNGSSSHYAVWTLSQPGLRMLYGASTTLINSSSVSRSSSDTSATTSSGGTSRFLSSSSSTSLSASPPPFSATQTTPAAPPIASPGLSAASPRPPPPPASTLRPLPPPPLAKTTSLHRPTPARLVTTLATAAAARRPPPFLPPPPRPPSDASEHSSHS